VPLQCSELVFGYGTSPFQGSLERLQMADICFEHDHKVPTLLKTGTV